MGFLFVDRITEIDSGKWGRGCFTVPKNLPGLSPCLVAEAVGQLAAWVAMAKAEFQSRLVAGVTGEARISGSAAPGAILALEVELESYESDAVLYDGRAYAGGLPIIELSRCVGPMLPMEDFDDPQAVRKRFQLLCEAETPLEGFSGDATVSPRIVVNDHHPGKRLRAQLSVPRSAPFFADHFPRKPVVPGTVLLEVQTHLALTIAAETVDSSVRPLLRPTRFSNVKLRSFVHPGQTVEINAEIIKADRATTAIALTAEVEGQRVSTARVEVGQWEVS